MILAPIDKGSKIEAMAIAIRTRKGLKVLLSVSFVDH